jgi:hypothetical protein
VDATLHEDHKISAVQFDNAKETGTSFDMLKSMGVHARRSPAYAHSSNGHAEKAQQEHAQGIRVLMTHGPLH